MPLSIRRVLILILAKKQAQHMILEFLHGFKSTASCSKLFCFKITPTIDEGECKFAGPRQDELLERAFWSSVTINPPLYGADNPTSLFDKSLDFGWNLNELEDLLKKHQVAPIPGVTTPMVYFGM